MSDGVQLGKLSQDFPGSPFSTTVSIGRVSSHSASTEVRVVYAEGYAAFFIPALDPQLSVILPLE
jgi:hypothetical protein